MIRVLDTRDSYPEAKIRAEELWTRRRKVGVMSTQEWNRYYPERIVRTANRYVIYGESS